MELRVRACDEDDANQVDREESIYAHEYSEDGEKTKTNGKQIYIFL